MLAVNDFWAPFAALWEAMKDPLETSPAVGVFGWIAALTALAGIVLCARNAQFGPMIVLAAVLPCYLALVIMISHVHPRVHMQTVTMAGIAVVLSVAGMAMGFVKSRGNSLAASLMLPTNALFLFALALLTAISVRR